MAEWGMDNLIATIRKLDVCMMPLCNASDKGIETPGLTLIHVKAQHIKYWDGWDEVEVAVPQLSPLRMAS